MLKHCQCSAAKRIQYLNFLKHKQHIGTVPNRNAELWKNGRRFGKKTQNSIETVLVLYALWFVDAFTNLSYSNQKIYARLN
jgi:hypothetical protein